MQRFTLAMTYLIEFTVCAFCGWLYEEGLELAVNHAYADRGLLHLPVLPIYGFGGLLLVWLRTDLVENLSTRRETRRTRRSKRTLSFVVADNPIFS